MKVRISDVVQVKVNHIASVKMPWVTPLRIWSSRHGFTYNTAAAALGVSRRTYARLLKRDVLKKMVLLAMRRIDDERRLRDGYCSMQGRDAA